MTGPKPDNLLSTASGATNARVRPSQYNIFLNRTDDHPTLLFNSYSMSLIALEFGAEERDVRRILSQDSIPLSYSDAPEHLVSALIRNGFLIQADRDELTELCLQADVERYSTARLMLTILPTLRCNFRCVYCFEDHADLDMPQEIMDGILGYAKQQRSIYQYLSVTWFGGEPLLRLDAIKQLTPRLKDTFPNFYSHIITNGFLLDAKTATVLLESGVSSAQVTLDGPREYHEKRRVHVMGFPTYDRILANVCAASELGLAIELRVNVDQDLAEQPALLARFYKEVLEKSGARVQIYFSPQFGYLSAPVSLGEKRIPVRSFVQALETTYRVSLNNGLGISIPKFQRAPGYCIAVKPQSYTIAPDGMLYKCWEEPGCKEDRPVGNILALSERTMNDVVRDVHQNAWKEWNTPECRACQFLPICMGSCARVRMSDNRVGTKDDQVCEYWEHWVPAVMRLRYTNDMMSNDLAIAKGDS